MPHHITEHPDTTEAAERLKRHRAETRAVHARRHGHGCAEGAIAIADGLDQRHPPRRRWATPPSTPRRRRRRNPPSQTSLHSVVNRSRCPIWVALVGGKLTLP